MLPTPFLEKMSDWDVIQRVIDYWAPIGYGYNDSLSAVDEYDGYVTEVLDILKKNDPLLLNEHLDYLQFKRMGVAREPRAIAKSQFITWSLNQVWKTQQDPETNLRICTEKKRFNKDKSLRLVTEMEFIQSRLEIYQNDKIANTFDHWLWGADSLRDVDRIALEFWNSAQEENMEEKIFKHLVNYGYTCELEYNKNDSRLREIVDGILQIRDVRHPVFRRINSHARMIDVDLNFDH